MNRRNFLKGAALTVAAPMIIKASHLMRVWVPPEPEIFTGFELGHPYDFIVSQAEDQRIEDSFMLTSKASHGDVVWDQGRGEWHMRIGDDWRRLWI